MNKEQGTNQGAMGHDHAMCGHGMCCHGHHRFFWLRWLLGIIILAAVFGIGVKVGEFKGEFGSQGFGRHGGNMMYQRQGVPMMRVYNQAQPWVQATPASTATTTAK